MSGFKGEGEQRVEEGHVHAGASGDQPVACRGPLAVWAGSLGCLRGDRSGVTTAQVALSSFGRVWWDRRRLDVQPWGMASLKGWRGAGGPLNETEEGEALET